MPEGPEVERVRQELLVLIGREVKSCSFTKLALSYNRYSAQDYSPQVINKTKLENIQRKGKYLIWKFTGKKDVFILNHLGMTGSWIIFNNEKEKIEYIDRPKVYSKVIIDFIDQSSCVFEDMRNFGRFHLFTSIDELNNKFDSVRKIGLDGFDFPIEDFIALLEKKKFIDKQLGILLLDQSFVSGVGNIYKSESLWRARLSPFLTPRNLNNEEINRLANSIQSVLKEAFNDGGSTIINFKANNSEGRAQKWHAVYGREKQPCKKCNESILRVIQMNRSTFFCPNCQPFNAQK